MAAEYGRNRDRAAENERAKELARNALEAIEGEIMETNPAVTAGDAAACLWVSKQTDERLDDRTVVGILEDLEAEGYVHSRDYEGVTVWFNPKASVFHRDYVTDLDAPWPPLTAR